jgi:hypothetical protein
MIRFIRYLSCWFLIVTEQSVQWRELIFWLLSEGSLGGLRDPGGDRPIPRQELLMGFGDRNRSRSKKELGRIPSNQKISFDIRVAKPC